MNPLQSAGRRVIQKFGVSFGWAAVMGTLLGAGAYYRVEPDDTSWHAYVRGWLERVEWATFDWRARQLGEEATRSDEVVMLALDDDTSASARESENATLATRPWPRELYGQIASQAVDEGAAVVLFDLPFFDLSPRTCAVKAGQKTVTDDDAFAQWLVRTQGRAVMTFNWAHAAPRPAEKEPRPFLVKLADFDAAPEAIDEVRSVLASRAPAYLIAESDRTALWAGVASEQRAKELFASSKPRPVRPQMPEDVSQEVGRDWLLSRLAKVTVDGLDPSKLPSARSVEAPAAPLLLPALHFGFSKQAADPDGVVRGVSHFIAHTEADGRVTVLASAAVVAAMQLLHTQKLKYEHGLLRIGDRISIPMDETGRSILRWDAADVGRGDRGTLKRSIPLWRLVVNRQDDEEGKGLRHYENDLSDRIAVLSDTQEPKVLTPVGALRPSAVLAQAVVNLLHSQGIARVAPRTDFWLTVAFAFAGAFLAVAYSSAVRRPGWLGYVATLGALAFLHAFVARQLLVDQHRWVAMAAPLMAATFTFLASLGYAAALEKSLRDFVTGALGRAVLPEVLGRVVSNISLMRPERRELAVYFSDIEGFTALSQQMPPRELVVLLREYLRAMTDIVIATHGQVDKYLGDGVMAFWGAPLYSPNPSVAACEAALRMRRAFDQQRTAWEQRAQRALIFRAALEVGETVVGEMGTEHRVNYTVMGEAVATAAKLEALAKKYDARILAGPALVARAKEAFIFRSIDRVRLAKQSDPVEIFELLGAAADESVLRPSAQRFEAALVSYRNRKFSDAAVAFGALAKEGDAVSARYAARCRHYQALPPPEKWDGVFVGPEDI